jgi:hypothetical protein
MFLGEEVGCFYSVASPVRTRFPVNLSRYWTRCGAPIGCGQFEVEPYLRLGFRCPVGVPVFGSSPSEHPRSARAWPGMGDALRDLAGEPVEAEFCALDGE